MKIFKTDWKRIYICSCGDDRTQRHFISERVLSGIPGPVTNVCPKCGNTERTERIVRYVWRKKQRWFSKWELIGCEEKS